MDQLAIPAPPTAGHVLLDRAHGFLVSLPPEKAFQFFEPVGEKAWAEDWQPVFATNDDAELHDGSVFVVDRPHPDGNSRLTSLWTVTHYDPPRCIEYRNFIPGVRATRITVGCAASGHEATRVEVRYVYTGLSAAGDNAIRAITADEFGRSINGWGEAIAAYLQRGTPASP